VARGFTHHVAIGDPQAPFSRFLDILDWHGLLGSRRRLRADVQLVAIGDYFDWGQRADRARATRDGLALLTWLADQPVGQTVLVAGNHDLARVGELARFTTASFARARALADAQVARGKASAPVPGVPGLPTAELLARDFSTFSVPQRRLVTALLRRRRLRLAFAHQGRLVVHAGITREVLRTLEISAQSAEGIATGLNAFLDARVRRWKSGPLDLAPFHVPGDEAGEGGGALYHRPAEPKASTQHQFEGSRRRRFHPTALPAGLVQVIGHIRNAKCVQLMPRWSRGVPTQDGQVRSLAVVKGTPRYRLGVQDDPRLVFIDNGMLHVDRPSAYQLLDLDRLEPFERLR
jgi:hypothetical protein